MLCSFNVHSEVPPPPAAPPWRREQPDAFTHKTTRLPTPAASATGLAMSEDGDAFASTFTAHTSIPAYTREDADPPDVSYAPRESSLASFVLPHYARPKGRPYFPSVSQADFYDPELLASVPARPTGRLVRYQDLAHLPLPAYDESLRVPLSPSIPPLPSSFSDPFLFPTLAKNERERLTSLWYYTRNIQHDTKFLVHLQQTISLVQELIPWEVVLIGLVDKDCYTMLATENLSLAIMPRRESLCSHALNETPGTVLVIPDLSADWRWVNSPPAQIGLNAYAGTALHHALPDGCRVSLGAICVAAFSPRPPLTAQQERVLVRFAGIVMRDIMERARVIRAAERQAMTARLAAIADGATAEIIEDRVLQALRETYSGMDVDLQSSPDDLIDMRGAPSVPYSAFEGQLYEDTEEIDDEILRHNNVPEEIRPRHRTLRVVAALCPNTPHTYLVVRSAALDYVFDEIDAMFVHSCAALIANVQQADMLHRAASASARLLRGVSHELRTPLHALLSACELLSEESRARSRMLSPEAAAQSGTGGTGDSAALLAGALVSGRGLLGTVENLLMFDRMERGALAAAAHFGPLAALEQAVVDEAAAALVERGAPVTVLCESLLPHGTHLLWTDHDLLRKCLGALMNNAATFTHEGSISLCTWLEFDDTGTRGVLVFDVHDTGQGVPHEDIVRVFEPFEKASTESTGLGLGLTVASAIARSLGGNVSLVQSSPSGSHFRLYLADPVLASQPGHVSTRVTRATLPKTFCILSPQPHTAGLDNAARALRHSGFKEMTDEPAIAALVLVEALASSDSSSTLESALKRIKANQLVVCLCQANAQAESCARAVAQRVSADLPPRLLTINGPLHQDRLWRTLSAAADVFDRLRISMDAMLSVSGSVALSRSALRILVVDDNKTNRDILCTYSRRRGHPYGSAVDGEQAADLFALDARRRQAFTLVLMDLQMPVLDGVESVRRIRAFERHHSMTPCVIFMVSGQSFADDKQRAAEAGANAYLVKPLSMRTLDHLIELHFPVDNR